MTLRDRAKRWLSHTSSVADAGEFRYGKEEVDSLTDLLARVRAEALEEAAKVADARCTYGCDETASSIRALKEQGQ